MGFGGEATSLKGEGDWILVKFKAFNSCFSLKLNDALLDYGYDADFELKS